MVELFANSGDPYQMPHSVASDLGLHCLPVTLLGVSRLQCVKVFNYYIEIHVLGSYKFCLQFYASPPCLLIELF